MNDTPTMPAKEHTKVTVATVVRAPHSRLQSQNYVLYEMGKTEKTWDTKAAVATVVRAPDSHLQRQKSVFYEMENTETKHGIELCSKQAVVFLLTCSGRSSTRIFRSRLLRPRMKTYAIDNEPRTTRWFVRLRVMALGMRHLVLDTDINF